jgi:hypothetical protein
MAAIQQLLQTSTSKAQPLFSEHSPMAGYVATMTTMANLLDLALTWPLS